jgi:hypothetical protein
MMTGFIRYVSSPPRDLFIKKDINDKDVNHDNWTKWLNNVQDVLNSPAYYGYPSLCLNSDFNFQSGVPSSINQGNGDGALWAQLWKIHGASIATYTITHTAYSANNDNNSTGSLYYVNFDVTNYTGDGTGSDFYGYQQFNGAQYLQQFQSRIISMSCVINNTQTKSINGKFEIYFNFNESSPDVVDMTYSSQVFEIAAGYNEISAQITTDDLSQYTVGASPYMQFRFVFCNLGDNTANINLQYVKAELADDATILYVDHFLEQTRIANF